MSHTPGPWEVQSHGHDFWVDTPCDPPQHRQDICRMSFRMTDHKVSADNARLIAAAPELLEALQRVEDRLTKAARAFYVSGKRNALQEALEGWQEDINPARAAIAKATGQ